MLIHDDDRENGLFSSPEEYSQNPSRIFRTVSESAGSKRIRLACPSNNRQELLLEDIDSSEESSTLGLKLSKSPSLISLLEQKLSSNTPNKLESNSSCDDHNSNNNKKPKSSKSDHDTGSSQSNAEKLKASNFPALLIRIGSWEKITKNEGHLVAKCYYAKRKLVWEVLEGALKSKIEILWSDIVGIRATIIDDQPGILEVELQQPPSFHKETNPQPRKHTLWQPASDFTGGQAPVCRRHYVKFAPGILDKHYERLMQCDPRLFHLSQRPFPSQEALYFDANTYGFSDFSLDFNGIGPQFLPGLPYPYPSYHPAHSFNFQNLRQAATAQPHSNLPLSVNDLIALEKQRRAALLLSAANQTHLATPIVTAPTIGGMEEQLLANAMALEELKRKSNGNMGLLNHVENHLLASESSSDQMVSLSDEDLIRMNYEQLVSPTTRDQMVQSNVLGGASAISYTEPTNWVSHYEFDDGVMPANSSNSSNSSPYAYSLVPYPMTEDFSNFALNCQPGYEG